MARKIICSNDDGVSVTFNDTFSPFLLENCDGIYCVTNNVTTSENTAIDGSTYQGSVTKMRNIVLTLRDKPGADHQYNRNLLYNLFKPKSAGTFTYYEDDDADAKIIEYYVETIDIDSVKRARQATVSLLCPDPFFTDPEDLTVTMAGWDALWEFEHEFQDGGEEFGARVAEYLKTIENSTGIEGIGLTITITALGSVTNPSVTHVESGEVIEVGTESNPLELVLGNQVVITTGTNNKHVYLVQDGVQTEINQYLSEDSEFIQLISGTNTIGYFADNGEEYMTVEISYRYKYLGV